MSNYFNFNIENINKDLFQNSFELSPLKDDFVQMKNYDEIKFNIKENNYDDQINKKPTVYEDVNPQLNNNIINNENLNSYNNNKIDENKKREIREKVYNKISNILPQDIICILPDNNIIKETYNENKNYYNLKDYISDEENKKYKISIIYTFNNIANSISGINNEMKIMISDIKSENELNNIINEMKSKNEEYNRMEKTYNIVIDLNN